MAIRRAPKKDDISKVIKKGGSVSADKEKKKWKMINLRIPSDVIDQIDDILEDRYMHTRTSWILEAIAEKLSLKND